MNVKFAIGMLMSATGAVWAQITMAPAPSEPAATNLPPASLTDTNHVLTIPLSPPEFPIPASPGSLSGVAPGVYVTKPFSCMVMVPGQQPDDCIIPATVPTNSIPNAKPSLKFEPLPPADGI